MGRGFPGTGSSGYHGLGALGAGTSGLDQGVEEKNVQAIKRAAQTAGIEKRVTSHALRHSFTVPELGGKRIGTF